MSQKTKGILCIITSAFFFAVMNVFVRMAGDLPSVQKSFFRNLVAIFFAAAVLLRELPSLQKQAAANARQQALATVQANGQASPGALAGPTADDAPDFERMPSSEFAEYHRRALRGEWV